MQSVLDFIVAHQGIFAGLGVGLLDLVFSLKSDWASNSILHWVYLSLKSLSGPKPPAS